MKSSVRFCLNKAHREDLQLILLDVRWSGHRFRTTLNYSLNPNCWDKEKRRANRNLKNSGALNAKLELYENAIKSYFINARQTPSESDVKEFIIPLISSRKQYEKSDNLISNFKDFIKSSKDGSRLTKSGTRIQPNTTKTYNTVLLNLQEFEKKYKSKLTFNDFNKKFESAFLSFLGSLGVSQTTCETRFKVLKTFLHWLDEEKIYHNQDALKLFKQSRKETLKISLTKEEIEAIECLEESERKENRELAPYLVRTKDMFLFQVYTGLRISDLYNLKPANVFLKQQVIRMNLIKTSVNVTIPLFSKSIALLEKYDMKFPLISEQRYNDYIKIVCQKAGINKETLVESVVNSKKVQKTYAKYDLCSSHTGRRSFITQSLLRGVLPEQLMKITGHTSRASFNKYVLVEQEEAVSKVRSVWE